MITAYALLLVLATVTTVLAEPPAVTPSEVRSLLASRKCSEARKLIQDAPNRSQFLGTPEGQALYAGSLCYSSPRQLSMEDVENALRYAKAAEEALRDTDKPLAIWTKNAARTCETLRQQVARGQRDTRFAEFSGKIAGACGPNPSSIFLPRAADPGQASSILAIFQWVPAPPGIDGTQSPPPDGLLAAAKADHQAPGPAVAVCPPFVAVSSDQDPQHVCDATQRYYDYFEKLYEPSYPASWIIIHHYATDKQMLAHVKKFKGPNCTGMLGYYDWHRQAIAFRAPPGYFGTLQHELTHALIFWDIPMSPRWFEEGLAALYENTDRNYNGLPNPWREDILKRLKNPEVNPAYFSRVLKMDPMEYEHTAEPATLSRALMMRLQKCGDLIGLYRNVRDYSLGQSPREGHSYDSPTSETVARWQEMLKQCDCR